MNATIATDDRVTIHHRDGTSYRGTVLAADERGIVLAPGYSCRIEGVGTFVYQSRTFLPWKSINSVDFEEPSR